jgi:integrase
MWFYCKKGVGMKEIKKIKNPHYLKFLQEGLIDLLTEEQILQALNRVRGRYKKEGRALIITLYLTGARPNEALRLKAKDIKRDGNHLRILIRGSKGGKARTIHLSMRNKLTKELYNYTKDIIPEILIFFHYRNKYTRYREIIRFGKPTGEFKQITTITDKLRYHFKIWFKDLGIEGIPPYFLRHNRFSSLAEQGATRDQLYQLKGASDDKSIDYYTHLSTDSSKKLSKLIK